MKYLYNDRKENIKEYIKFEKEQIQEKEEQIALYKEGIKRFNALKPYVEKATEGEFDKIMGGNLRAQVKQAISMAEKRIKDCELSIRNAQKSIEKLQKEIG